MDNECKVRSVENARQAAEMRGEQNFMHLLVESIANWTVLSDLLRHDRADEMTERNNAQSAVVRVDNWQLVETLLVHYVDSAIACHLSVKRGVMNE